VTAKGSAQRTREPSPMSCEPIYALNAICPYFTMFPLEYPMRALHPSRLRTYKSALVCDPYCGRGTTVFAARLRGVRAYGMDIAPVAVAIARAKLATTTTAEVDALLGELLESRGPLEMPSGTFWEWAFNGDVLEQVCRIRSGLMNRRGAAAALLRAVMLGALHGPRAKTKRGASYLSNQMPRTFAAKPDYALRFWRKRRRKPPRVDIQSIVAKRAERALGRTVPSARTVPADIQCADSRSAAAFHRLEGKITHVVTSPPYYGLRTYSQDQWLREWFLGGSTTVNYGVGPGLDHSSPEAFSKSLADVWDNVGNHAAQRIRVCIRFGGIPSRRTSAEDILRDSFEASAHPWRVLTRHPAATAKCCRCGRQTIRLRRATTLWAYADARCEPKKSLRWP
jgi:hypothetical protein